MKKTILTALAVFTFGAVSAQSNDEGTFHINLLGGFTFGGNVTDKPDEGEDSKYKFAFSFKH